MVVKSHKVNLGCEGQEWLEESERLCNSRRSCRRCQERRMVMDIKKMERG